MPFFLQEYLVQAAKNSQHLHPYDPQKSNQKDDFSQSAAVFARTITCKNNDIPCNQEKTVWRRHRTKTRHFTSRPNLILDPQSLEVTCPAIMFHHLNIIAMREKRCHWHVFFLGWLRWICLGFIWLIYKSKNGQQYNIKAIFVSDILWRNE